MKLRATCTACDREMLLSQATDPGPLQGLCPWCGATLAPQNTVVLVDAANRIEHAMDELVRGLLLLNGIPGHFRILTEDIAKHLHDEAGLDVEMAGAR